MDFNEEFYPSDEPTREHYIVEPDDYMDELEFEEADTGVYEMPLPLVKKP